MTVTISHTFYNQHSMLALHAAAWQSHPLGRTRYILIDDASPEPISSSFNMRHLDVYRIHQDIPWNIAGARNLAFHVADTDWVLCADIDHVVTPDAMASILDLDLTDTNVAYTFARRMLDGHYGKRPMMNILMSKRRYFEVGGHDEDFSGHYGKEEAFFYGCLIHAGLRLVYRDDIVLTCYPQLGMTTGLSRDKSINSVLFNQKVVALKNRTYLNHNLLRFDWTHVTRPALGSP